MLLNVDEITSLKMSNRGNKVNDRDTSQTFYWKIINRMMNKCRAPIIPPLFVKNVFVLNCGEKAKFSMTFFLTSTHLSQIIVYYPH